MRNKDKNMPKIENLENFMTKNVISVRPDMPLTLAVEQIINKNFNGVPVVNGNNKVVGILTELELMVKGSSIHLPTLLKLLGNFEVYGKDKKFINSDLKKIVTLKVKDLMNKNPIVLKNTDHINDAVNAFCKYKDANPIPVVDEKKRLVGIISRYDIVKFFRQSSSSPLEFKNHRRVDHKINIFLKNFERNFLFVSKLRTHYWFIFSLIFAFFGFAVAFLMIIQISGE